MTAIGRLISVALFLGVVAVGSQPEPAAAFACSTDASCPGGCKTVLSPTGAYEGVHVSATGCTWPGCQKTFATLSAPEVEKLVHNTSNGDVKAAVRLATKFRLSVRYDEDRHALMYYSACTGDVPIGVQPLNADQNIAVAAAVAD